MYIMNEGFQRAAMGYGRMREAQSIIQVPPDGAFPYYSIALARALRGKPSIKNMFISATVDGNSRPYSNVRYLGKGYNVKQDAMYFSGTYAQEAYSLCLKRSNGLWTLIIEYTGTALPETLTFNLLQKSRIIMTDTDTHLTFSYGALPSKEYSGYTLDDLSVEF